MTSATVGEIDSIKARLKSIWTAGDYDRFSRFMVGGAREFYERLNIAPGCHLLDVACGSGQIALMAAKDGVEVTGVDIAGNLVERARARAQAEGLNAIFREAVLANDVAGQGDFKCIAMTMQIAALALMGGDAMAGIELKAGGDLHGAII